VKGISEVFENVGVPFFAKYQHLNSAFKVLRSKERDERLLCPILGCRLMRLVAAGSLLCVDLGEEVIAGYDAALVETRDLLLPSFRALCQGIREGAAARTE
jgi:hypothetical protein